MSILILDLMDKVNPVRNSSGALNPAGIILKSNPAAEQRGIISNGVNSEIPAYRQAGAISFYGSPYLPISSSSFFIDYIV
jgi:hypothetical protein